MRQSLSAFFIVSQDERHKGAGQHSADVSPVIDPRHQKAEYQDADGEPSIELHIEQEE